VKPLYCLTIFLGSLLLFGIQPMVGKILLSSFGGTPAVWTTCVLFFQGLLLVGYGYAHFVSGRLSPAWQVKIHLTLLAAVTLFLPMQTQTAIDPSAQDNPSLWLLWQLTIMTGLPFLVVSSNAPLLQRWYSVAAGKKGTDPYFLYAFSNAGSLLALLAYPLLMERSFGLTGQSGIWTAGFSLLAICCAGCGWFVFRHGAKAGGTGLVPLAQTEAPTRNDDLPLTWRQRWLFIGLAAVPSSLMLGVTTFITTDTGSVPLLWVVPLAIYLLTFILGFAKHQIIPHRWTVSLLPHLVLLVALLLLVNPVNSSWLLAPAHLLAFFVVAMACHGELARLRPSAGRLTEFFFLLSIGGAVGGFFNAIVAPLVFSNVLEYPLILVLACFLPFGLNELPSTKTSCGWWIVAGRMAVPMVIATWLFLVVRAVVMPEMANAAAVLYLVIVGGLAWLKMPFGRRIRFAGALATLLFMLGLYISDRDVIDIERGFFGVIKVKADEKNGMRMLVHGTTIHGMQRVDGDVREPLSYYHRTGPVGDLFRIANLPASGYVGVIGLGAGSIASYSRFGQRFDFFEIDPVVCRYANDKRIFSFLSDADGECRILLGDGRIRLRRQLMEQSSAQSDIPVRKVAWVPGDHAVNAPAVGVEPYDLLILDAFSSDSIPAHLMTREAFAIYSGRLKQDGILGVHISNRFLDLEPLCAALADDAGLQALIRVDLCEHNPEATPGKKSSIYVVMSRNTSLMKQFAETGNWLPLKRNPGLRLWTDDYSCILDVLR